MPRRTPVLLVALTLPVALVVTPLAASGLPSVPSVPSLPSVPWARSAAAAATTATAAGHTAATEAAPAAQDVDDLPAVAPGATSASGPAPEPAPQAVAGAAAGEAAPSAEPAGGRTESTPAGEPVAQGAVEPTADPVPQAVPGTAPRTESVPDATLGTAVVADEPTIAIDPTFDPGYEPDDDDAADADTATPQYAATPAPDQIRWNGASIYKQSVVATVVDLEVWSSTPAAKVELLLGGVVVATDTTIERRYDHWLGTARVDLTGLSGSTSITMRVTTPEGVVRSERKVFTADAVVAPLTAEILARRPGAHNTGVPAGTVLRPSGTLRVTQPGAVIDGLDIAGCLVIDADDVTVRNTRIRCTSTTRNRAVVMDGKHKGFLLEDVEIDGGGSTEIGIDVTDAVIRRVDVHHVNDGIRMGANLVIEDSWIHHMTRRGSLHPDAIQGISAKNIVIRNNTLDPRNPDTGDLANAAIMLGSETGTKTSENVLIEGNFMSGGNYTLNVSGSITATGFVIRQNRFGGGARYGAIITRQSVPAAPDNVVDATGTRVRVVYIR
ncbi:right-handed parallel beta-helix repeat-containing protein [Actinotalea sp. AC32]|nr:right-handed parallel beta-helix repeat-containing protein [Actinotalea sp. AC32]